MSGHLFYQVSTPRKNMFLSARFNKVAYVHFSGMVKDYEEKSDWLVFGKFNRTHKILDFQALGIPLLLGKYRWAPWPDIHASMKNRLMVVSIWVDIHNGRTPLSGRVEVTLGAAQAQPVVRWCAWVYFLRITGLSDQWDPPAADSRHTLVDCQ